jgi:rhomboid protease GluP
MPNCVHCGKELPSFSFGDLKEVCPECRRQREIQAPVEAPVATPVVRRPATLEIARLFPVTSAIIVINLLIYLLCAVATLKTGRGSVMDFDPRLLLTWGADFGPLTLDREWWRLFTSMFLHGGLIHVGANMYCLWSLGPIVERVYGRSRYVIIYLLTGLGSSLASLAVHPTTISVGASGAIFGVVGALVFPFYRKRVLLPPPAMKAMLRSLGMFIVVNLAIGSAIPVIDNSAHIGGLLVGFALGAILTQLAISGADLTTAFPKVAIGAALLLALGYAGVRHLHREQVLPGQAYLWLQTENVQRAIEAGKRAVSRDPQSALAHLSLGEAYDSASQKQEAVKEYESAHRLAPEDGYAAGRLGVAYYAMDRVADAEPLLRQAVKEDPDDSISLETLGLAEAKQGKLDEALTTLQQAAQKNPKSAATQYAIGSVLMDQQQYHEAIVPLREAVRLQPNNEDFKKTLAEVEEKVRGMR